jgi:regulator of protease activity HflC (stomatin/prohibitin superfamily)
VTELLVVLAVIVGVLAMVAASCIRVLREYERAVVFRLGRLIGQKGPGLIVLVPIIDRMVRVDLRTIVLDIPPQDLITRDNVPAKVNAVTYFRVVDAPNAVIAVERYQAATSQIAQTTLRSVLGKADLDMLLGERERLNEALQQIIDDQTDPWGVKVTAVEIKDVEIPGSMQRAMARQAEAERERRAKVIHAEGEFQASTRLRDAADVIGPSPAALQLRYLQTLSEVGRSDNSTIVFPLPLDVVRSLVGDRIGDDSPGREDDGRTSLPAAEADDRLPEPSAGDAPPGEIEVESARTLAPGSSASR